MIVLVWVAWSLLVASVSYLAGAETAQRDARALAWRLRTERDEAREDASRQRAMAEWWCTETFRLRREHRGLEGPFR